MKPRNTRGKDFTGKRYGKLEITRFVGMTTKTAKPESVWRADCDCKRVGGFVVDTLRMIRTHRHCGCETKKLEGAGRPRKIQADK